MKFEQAIAEAKRLSQEGTPHSVVYADVKSAEFFVGQSSGLGDRFPHYHGHEWLPTKLVTFCIASRDDDERLQDTITSIYASCDPAQFSIIIVMDSDRKGKNIWRNTHPEITCIWHGQNKGVGAAFDTAVARANTEQVFLMGADLRFPDWDKTWLPRFVEKVKQNPKAIICTRCGRLNKDNPWLDPDTPSDTGAGILFRHKKAPETFLEMLQAEWIKPNIEGGGLKEIGCILGAFYGVNKGWYNEIKGFQGHRQWGTLEPLISLRSWLMGGKCMIDMDLTVGHIFNIPSTKSIPELIFNKLLLADTLLPDDLRDEVFKWAKGIKFGVLAIKEWEQDEQVKKLKAYFKENMYEGKAFTKRLRQSFKDLGQNDPGKIPQKR